MQTILTSEGDSTAAIIPESVLKQAGIELGNLLEIVLDGDRLIVTKAANSSRTEP